MSKDVVSMLEDYIKKVQKWPCPPSYIHIYIHIIFRSFFPRYSALTNHMNLMKKVLKFEWPRGHGEEFKEVESSSQKEKSTHIQTLTTVNLLFSPQTGLL